MKHYILLCQLCNLAVVTLLVRLCGLIIVILLAVANMLTRGNDSVYS